MNSVDYYSKICSVKHMCIRENRREGEAMKKRCMALLLFTESSERLSGFDA